jgi:hypothetical protein
MKNIETILQNVKNPELKKIMEKHYNALSHVTTMELFEIAFVSTASLELGNMEDTDESLVIQTEFMSLVDEHVFGKRMIKNSNLSKLD